MSTTINRLRRERAALKRELGFTSDAKQKKAIEEQLDYNKKAIEDLVEPVLGVDDDEAQTATPKARRRTAVPKTGVASTASGGDPADNDGSNPPPEDADPEAAAEARKAAAAKKTAAPKA